MMTFLNLLIGLFAVFGGIGIATVGLPLFVVLLPLTAFFTGFLAGAGATAAAFGGGFLAAGLGIVFGLGVGVLFAILSYFFWYFGVAAAFAIVGFTFGAALFAALGITSGGFLFIIGTGFAVLFVIGVISTQLPIILVVIGTALSGSAIAIGGLLVMFGRLDPTAIGDPATWQLISDNLVLWLLWLLGAGAGSVVQLSLLSQTLLPSERWTSVQSGGRKTI